jgi:phosphohistidine phosphatase SixA
MALGALERANDEEAVALVGHEPLIRAMAAHLIGYSKFPGFRAGAACLVQIREGTGAFQWLLDPKTMSRVDTLDDLSP